MQQMNCLKPGGVAIHTTEFNLTSNTQTYDSGPVTLYRQSDIDCMVQTLRAAGHSIEIDYSIGNGDIESKIATINHPDIPFLRLLLGRYVTTSIGLIIQKGKGT